MSGFPYTGWASRAVHGAKYGGERDRASFLGCVLAADPSACGILRAADVVVPVPMFAARERERGYNQAAVMADAACRALGRSAPVHLLAQHEQRRSQVGLSARDRRTNVRGSFSTNPSAAVTSGMSIVLVDDVRTTGATVSACVDALRGIRPSRVDVVTLAAELSDEASAMVAGVGSVSR